MTAVSMVDDFFIGNEQVELKQLPFKLLFHDFQQKSEIAWDAFIGIGPKSYDSPDCILQRLISSQIVKHAVVALDYDYYDGFSTVPGPTQRVVFGSYDASKIHGGEADLIKFPKVNSDKDTWQV